MEEQNFTEETIKRAGLILKKLYTQEINTQYLQDTRGGFLDELELIQGKIKIAKDYLKKYKEHE